ncbi:DUF2177 family protein [Alteromonas sp. CYL-A6]|uniref:DUF2177 family protein n=1 Tax=Alteromonas nitratireducens TaxID=3390813 RepID=UPI0034B03D61
MSKRYLKAYLAVLFMFALLDGVWLGVVAMDWYRDAFSTLLRDPFITWPWVVFYLGYSAAVVGLAVNPERQETSLTCLGRGALLGAAAYGTYNLTGYAIISDWPLGMTLVDLAWGTVATALLAVSGHIAAR